MKRVFGLVAIGALILISSALCDQTIARSYWPDKEGVTLHLVEYRKMLDSPRAIRLDRVAQMWASAATSGPKTVAEKPICGHPRGQSVVE